MNANLQQLMATDPLQSAWVAANAGSGKTHVLVNRIARLLLSGSAPDRLLCLTFTKAAAAEMSTRLFGRLGTWTLLPDDALRLELSEMCGEEVADELVVRARKLFAEALESPGGLRIQTIHAFCERLLKRFPLEANVSPQFGVLDELATEELLADARDDVLRVMSQQDPDLGRAIGELTAFANDEQFDGLIHHVIAERSWIGEFLEAHRGAGIDAALRQVLKLPPTLTDADIDAQIVNSMATSDLARLAAALRKGGKKDQARAEKFQAAANAPSVETLQEVLGSLLKKDGDTPAALASKAALAQGDFVADLLSTYTDLALDVAAKRNGLFIAHHTANLLRVAQAIYDVYHRHKSARAVLDYDDLINRTAGLFRSPGAHWVLYKLDGGIDHVLVDEAQDTSPNQWQIIKHIAAEFFAGAGAEREHQAIQRTIFAVGDIKQSIMSFQGARPIEFKITREHIEQQAQGANAQFDRVELTQSFRTAPRILQLVDKVFENPAASDGVTIDEVALRHEARRDDMEGEVELWPLVRVPDAPERVAWDAPKDRVSSDHPAVLLAEQIAQRVQGWLRAGAPVHDKALKGRRRMTAGDVMILVRRRGTLANEIIRQLKRLGIQVAGADRLVLSSHIAVMDLIAVGRFALLPRDDLSLATVLRSPFCGVSEQALFDLAHGRGKQSIWSVMSAAPGDPRWADAYRFLDRVRDMADHQQPYEFFATILGEMDGWKKMMVRLGLDAADPIEEFMSAALDFGRVNTPSLEAFLHTIEQSETEIKRDQDRGDGAVRVLTVHGSKGLEAPVVILPDTCTTPSNSRHDSELLQAGHAPLWKLKADRDTPVRAAARDAGRDERMREYRRLLYVALTRPRDRLIICGYETGRTKTGTEEGCWYDLVTYAMRRLDAKAVKQPDDGEILRIGSIPDGTTVDMPVAPTVRELAPGLPNWITARAPSETVPEPLLATDRFRRPSPSAEATSEHGKVLDRGLAVHRILDAMAGLPEQRWAPVALEIAREMLVPSMVQGVVTEALRVRQDPAFADLFAVNSRGEFPLRGELEWQGRVHKFDWRLDRLVVREADVLVLEFKTDQVVPRADSAVRPQYVRQLALYRRAVSSLFPGKAVSCGILWTVEPRLQVIPANMLDAAEHALDPPVGGS